MKVLYLECAMGASGDMLTGALSELLSDPDIFCTRMNSIGIDGLHFFTEKVQKCGISGTRARFVIHGQEEKNADISGDADTHHTDEAQHNHSHNHSHNHTHNTSGHGCGHSHEHAHTSLSDIKRRIAALKINDKIKSDIEAVYALIAEAESFVHNTSVEEIHFHELADADALADISAVCMLIDMLKPDTVIASPVNVGSGHIQCAHGILPVPAPACARLLRNIPVYAGGIQAELCTPTGAALLAYFVKSFGNLPIMRFSAIGYGMGSKDFAQANCLRAYWGESCTETEKNVQVFMHTENISELSCNIDDMSGEALAFACEILFENGALDVYTNPIGMKKSRSGLMLTCLCKASDTPRMAELILRHTSTLGVREKSCRRYVFERSEKTLQTIYGSVRIKTSSAHDIRKNKIEYEDAARIARSNNIPLAQVYKEIEKNIE